MNGQDILFARFARHQQLVRTLLVSDPDFASICSDFCMACDAEAHWRESSDGNLKRASEYAALADEIGTEIAAILRKHLDGFHS